MKKILLLLFLSLCFAESHAQNYDYLTLQLENGNKQSFFTGKGLTITFRADIAQIHSNGTEASVALADLASMFFENTPTGFHQPTVAQPSHRPNAVYSLDGRLVGRDTDRLPMKNGVYVVRQQGTTKKLLVK